MQVRELLGWERPVPGRNAALQLLNIKEALDTSAQRVQGLAPGATTTTTATAVDAMAAGTAAAMSMMTSEHTSWTYASATAAHRALTDACSLSVPKVLASLTDSLGRESARESSVWLNVLKEKDKAIVWVNNDGLTGGTAGGRFVRANKVAFSCSLSHANTEPHLSVVPAHGEFLKFRPLYVALGVREAFTVHDFAALTRELSNEHVDAVVPPQSLGTARHPPT